MENTIGILHNREDSEQCSNIKLIKRTLNTQQYSLLDITDKRQIGALDGLIINLEDASDYVKAFQWLIELKEEYSLFIWILISDNNSELTELYPHLSNNSVIEIIRSDKAAETLGVVIKNAFNYKKKLLSGETQRQESTSHFIDESKLSLVVHNHIIGLTRKEFKIMEILYENMENVVTYDEINRAVYGVSVGESIEKYKLANAVFHIRNKLKVQSFFEIEIIRTKGYILTYSKQRGIQ